MVNILQLINKNDFHHPEDLANAAISKFSRVTVLEHLKSFIFVGAMLTIRGTNPLKHWTIGP